MALPAALGIVAVATLSLSGGLPICEAHDSPEVTATIDVGSSPRGVGVNATTNRVYVSNRDSSTVSVIDGATNTVTATIAVGSSPNGVGVNATTDRVYVANETADTVSVIGDAPTPTPTPTATPIPGLGEWGMIATAILLAAGFAVFLHRKAAQR